MNENLIETRNIPVTIDKSHLVTIGEKLYTEKLSFLRELVNNAYDADATEVRVQITPNSIIIADNGSGMDEQGLRQYFTIGSTLKKAENFSPQFRRQRIGEFGIGKFAALAACKKFEVVTQRGGFHARLIFDKESWSKHEDWHLNIDILAPDQTDGDGSTITLHGLDAQFPMLRIRRYLAERTPINAADFAVWLNEEKISEEIVTGRQIPVHVATPYGTASGKITIVPVNHHLELPGIAVLVKGVLVRHEPLGMEKSRKSGVTRITGRINADFLPITSNRDDFIRDSPEFQAFAEAMKKEVLKVLDLLQKESNVKANAQASKVLKGALSKIGRVLKNYRDIFPAAQMPLGAAANPAGEKVEPGYAISRAEFVESQENLDPEILKRFQKNKSKKKTRRMNAILGSKSVIRNLKIANLDIVVRLEHLGKDDESAMAGGVIYINLDHPLYRTYQNKDELLTQHLTRVITKELTLQTEVKNPQEAFALQSNLLTDALREKGA